MNIETAELLELLSALVKAEMANARNEQWPALEIDKIRQQQEYLLATVREYFTELSQRIEDLETSILAHDERRRTLRLRLIKERKNLDLLENKRAEQGGEISVALENQIEETEKRIFRIQAELDRMIGTQELKGNFD